jgi:DNA-binding MarR family transcriptional regulator
MARGRTAKAPPPLEGVAQAAAFRSELRRFLHATEIVAAQEGLTPERYDLLLMLKAAEETNQPATVTTLCELLDLRQQGVTELVKRAVDAGLVLRDPSGGDGRVYHLRPSPEGEARLMRVFRALRADRAAFAESFDRLDLSFRASTETKPPGQRTAAVNTRRGRTPAKNKPAG